MGDALAWQSLIVTSRERTMAKKGYRVIVADNYHYMDEDAYTDGGTFQTKAEAEAAARRIVDECLEDALKQGAAPEKLLEGYRGFGEDPFVVPLGEGPRSTFSAWGYAAKRCEEICQQVQKKEKS